MYISSDKKELEDNSSSGTFVLILSTSSLFLPVLARLADVNIFCKVATVKYSNLSWLLALTLF